MNKVWRSPILLSLLFLLHPALAGTDPKTAKILEGINSVYYNLPREGLRRLHGEFRSDLIDKIRDKAVEKFGKKAPVVKALDGFGVSLDWDPSTGWEIESPSIPRSGEDRFDSGMDDLGKAMRSLAARIINLWSGFMVEEVFTAGDLQKFDARIGDGGDNLLVDLGDKQEAHHFVLDTGFKIHSVRGERTDGSKFAMDTIFDRSPRGYVLTGWTDQAGEEREVRIAYKAVEGFLLPSEMAVLIWDPKTGRSLEQACHFMNYKVEGAATDGDASAGDR
ncbi:MAG TPA: hypothetical protein VHE12_07435 [bacterium]|nr:hypothetical protein [bacterium]